MSCSARPTRTPGSLRVLFAHQSVGADIIAGLAAVTETSAPTVAPLELLTKDSDPRLLAHVRIGRNGDPRSKLADFAARLQTSTPAGIDLALMKLCYVDITTMAQAQAVFDDYRQAIRELQQRFPQLLLGHVTVPLRCPPGSWLAQARQLVQGPHREHECNRARSWFSEQLRATYGASGLVFDLADVESTRADGKRCGRRIGADFVPALAPDYTHDGGHLNAQGRRIAAGAFLRYLNSVEGILCRR